jgi:poly-beta-1,6-N-acetyl-D-glucosamine synthase
MITLIIITSVIILLYLLYPFWLTLIALKEPKNELETEEINGISVVLLSYNGKPYLNDKINFLIRELTFFELYELIIIDDNSSDGSGELLANFRNHENVRVLYNEKHLGIPFSMNLGIATAKYESVIFCDQRQVLSECIVKKIVEPLKYKNVGAVSGYISDQDKSQNCSFIRRHENYLKIRENKLGSLIGVYGPFYAIKKNCYTQIPDNIILDDLFLSLKIVRSKKIVILEDCQITDDCFSFLYDYKRTRRYFTGLLQILFDRSVINELHLKHLVMLIWHKYLRLLIPFFIFICYITSGFKAMQSIEYLVLFSTLTAIGLLALLPIKFIFLLKLRNLIRLTFFYFIALIDFIFKDMLFQRKATANKNILFPDLGNVKTK